MESDDWKQIEELVFRAGAAVASGQLTEMQTADAMSFHTLGLALLDIHDRLARFESTSNQPDKPRILVP